MRNILVLEDDFIQRKNLAKIIRQLGDIYNVLEASSVKEAMAISNSTLIDVFFIDIVINNSSGLNFALELRENNIYKLTWIVFVTSYKEYMVSAFKKTHCYDYILKPYDREVIENEIKLLISDTKTKAQLRQLNEKLDENYIIVNIKNVEVKIFTNEIIFVEVFVRTSIIHTPSGPFKIDYLSLTRLHSMIKDPHIVQSHRSYLVNTKYIRSIEKTNDKTAYKLHFYNTESEALLGRNYKQSVLEKFQNSMGENHHV